MRWTVIVPLRSLGTAKSRLRPASDTDAQHRALVAAIRRDCLAAVAATPSAARVLVVAERAEELETFGLAGPTSLGEVVVISDPLQPGLNQAIEHAETHARQHWPADGVAALVGDLPALTPATLQCVLDAADELDYAVVLDREGSGTTMLMAKPGRPLAPRFGAGSASRHLCEGAVALPAPAAARTDVDTPEDLAAARRLGLGPATSTVLSARAARNTRSARAAAESAELLSVPVLAFTCTGHDEPHDGH